MRIETARLILDIHQQADFSSLAAMWADPETMIHIGSPSSPQESWSRLLRYRGLWPLLGFGYWAVQESATGRYVGEVGFADFRRDKFPAIHGVPEAGWVLASWAQGRGYAREAMAAALAWLDMQQAYTRSACLIHPANAASLRLATRLGYTLGPGAKPTQEDTVLLTRDRAMPLSAAGPASNGDVSAPSAIPLR